MSLLGGVSVKNNLKFNWSELLGEYELVFTAPDGREYVYTTYDKYYARRVIAAANYNVGRAWAQCKKYFKEQKR
jgi:surface antigen